MASSSRPATLAQKKRRNHRSPSPPRVDDVILSSQSQVRRYRDFLEKDHYTRWFSKSSAVSTGIYTDVKDAFIILGAAHLS